MVWKNRIIMGIVLATMTLLMAYDFFPILSEVIAIPKTVVVSLLLLTIVAAFAVTGRHSSESTLVRFWWEVFLIGWILTLMLLFTLLGGVSQVNISFSNPFMWLLLFISLYDLSREYKKMKELQMKEALKR